MIDTIKDLVMARILIHLKNAGLDPGGPNNRIFAEAIASGVAEAIAFYDAELAKGLSDGNNLRRR